MANLPADAGSTESLPPGYDSTASRIFAIDVIRGVSLLGILLISIWEFGGFSIKDQTGLRLSQKGFDYYLFSSMRILFEGRMRALFSLVFFLGGALYLFFQAPINFHCHKRMSNSFAGKCG